MIASKLNPFKKSALILGAAGLAMTGVLAAPAHAKKAHIHIHLGIPAGVGYIDYGYGPSCYWLKKKAINTGSPYWWKKYKQCMYG